MESIAATLRNSIVRAGGNGNGMGRGSLIGSLSLPTLWKLAVIFTLARFQMSIGRTYRLLSKLEHVIVRWAWEHAKCVFERGATFS